MSAPAASALDAFAAGLRAGATVGTATRSLRALFRSAAVEPAEIEARMLVGAATRLDLTGLVRADRDPLDAVAAERLVGFAGRRLAGEPIGRILGVQAFFGREFALSAETLVPRADTETLVEAVLAEMSADVATIADLGVGSGAILVSLLAERPSWRGVATDLSLDALATARGNAAAHGVAARALFVRGSFSAPLATGGFDCIVSNPPYIPTVTIETLDREVRAHDPRLALDGGDDGLDAYRVIAADSRRVLKPGGLLALEIGHDQGYSVPALLDRAGFCGIRRLPDLAGRDRVVLARPTS